jgi:hypothetical protein
MLGKSCGLLLLVGHPRIPESRPVVARVIDSPERATLRPRAHRSEELRKRFPQELNARPAVVFPAVDSRISASLLCCNEGYESRRPIAFTTMAVLKVVARTHEAATIISGSLHRNLSLNARNSVASSSSRSTMYEHCCLTEPIFGGY